MTTETQDPTELQKLFEAADAGEPEAAKKDETPAPAAKADDEGGKADSSAAATQQGTDAPKPDGVLARDGKNVIPYNVLESARERAQAAETLAANLKAQLEAAQKVADAKAGGEAPAKADVQAAEGTGTLTADELAAIEADFPALGKLIKGFQGQIENLTSQLAPVTGERARTQAETVQDTIDANPKLAALQAEGGEKWQAALDLDRALRARAGWNSKPLADRFNQVVSLIEAEYGPVNAPSAPKKEEPTPDPKALAAAAAKKAEELAAGKVPTSLSSFKSGDAPAVDEITALENASSVQIAAKFGSMTPDQLDRYLSTL